MPEVKQEQERGARLLVVDDDQCVRELLSRWLREAGYALATANNAASGWEHLKKHAVDVVTLDIRMPGGSGLDLLDQIKEEFPDVAALMLTGQADTSAAVRALTHGAFGYLVKPVEREELLIQVRNGLKMRGLVIENRQYTRHLEDRVREQTRAIRRAHEETIHRLVAASLVRDEETGAHIRRTGLYSELLAATASWPADRIDQIRLAAAMHDVGKIGIPDAILCKPGQLTPEEISIMQAHTILGAKMLSGSASPVLRMAREIALCHHERWDGKGYPAGLTGGAIPEAARIVGIVDVYDALTHDRVYRPALGDQEVAAMMAERRETHFDPRLLDMFLSQLPEMRAIAQIMPDDGGECELFHPSTDVSPPRDRLSPTGFP
ncbi:MAG: response regulator [Planctomycetia bacterium]|nr:response regulator [Planctomycetia bacterium]